MCVCVRVCVSEIKREREIEIENERENESLEDNDILCLLCPNEPRILLFKDRLYFKFITICGWQSHFSNRHECLFSSQE